MKNDYFEGVYLSGLLKERAVESPDCKAYIFVNSDFTEETITYLQLYKRACSYARYLEDTGIKENDFCMLLFKQSIDFAVAFFACGIIKAIPVPLNMPAKIKNLSKWEKIAQETGTRAVLTSGKKYASLKRLFSNSEILQVIPIIHEQENYEEALLFTEDIYDGNEIAFLQYTSGSTALPKGIMVTQSAVLNNIKQIQRILGVDRDTVLVMWLPYYHDMGLIGGFLLAIYAGFPLVFMEPMDFVRNPIMWAEAISKYRATHTGAPNFSYNLLAEKLESYKGEDISFESLKCVFCGSEPINAKTMHRFGSTAAGFGFRGFNIFAGYGLGEGSLIVSGYVRTEQKMTYAILDKKAFSHNKVEIIEKNYLEKLPEIDADTQICLAGNGFVIEEHRIEIIDAETKEVLGANQIGEIKFIGKSVTKGYWGKKDITGEIFGTGKNGERTLLTGDLGFVDESGEVYITGRKKELMIINGCNYYPQDIERTISCSDNNFCENGTAAFSVQFGEDEERLAVVQEVKLSGMHNADCTAWAMKIRAAVAKEHNLQVHKITFIPKMHLPRTSSGKIQRLKAKQTEISGAWERIVGVSEFKLNYKALEKECIAPYDYIEFAEELVSGILGVSRTALDASRPFTEMGMNSIMLVLMCGYINKYLKTDLQVQELFSHNTIEALGKYLFSLRSNEYGKKEEAVYNGEELDRMSYDQLVELLNTEIGG
ncbi:acyl-CoA synthetase (AMP-forming)/AMP-acid ligase II [Ruminiclostridium sufflavum DSM 19573]|uniref:Acyl-CoA synthetase (AMP-forming)/AMP-acid ligase II n=1 Tax=Ruminiclostridium sufflavum DSM 19573 TaxID=1121337 RepID=A0A318XNH8_9FIRM|nr:AMP-binding protein [Ruminiclostridium sufflavum]PYG89176.1 acyl-CoA synthetase (AMP-forming)/AMP-acid ligase II [Ruminiclostridium sufflavum DSM 19573]